MVSAVQVLSGMHVQVSDGVCLCDGVLVHLPFVSVLLCVWVGVSSVLSQLPRYFGVALCLCYVCPCIGVECVGHGEVRLCDRACVSVSA